MDILLLRNEKHSDFQNNQGAANHPIQSNLTG
jgi:hypothetical protein